MIRRFDQENRHFGGFPKKPVAWPRGVFSCIRLTDPAPLSRPRQGTHRQIAQARFRQVGGLKSLMCGSGQREMQFPRDALRRLRQDAKTCVGPGKQCGSVQANCQHPCRIESTIAPLTSRSNPNQGSLPGGTCCHIKEGRKEISRQQSFTASGLIHCSMMYYSLR